MKTIRAIGDWTAIILASAVGFAAVLAVCLVLWLLLVLIAALQGEQ